MRKQFLMLALLGLTSIVALVSCSLSRPPHISPEQLLARAVYANSTLESVALQGSLHLSVPGVFSGSIVGTGALRRGGESSAFDLRVVLVRFLEEGTQSLLTNVVLRSPGPDRTYISLSERSGELAESLAKELGAAPQQTVWLLRASESVQASETPSPEQLTAILAGITPVGDSDILSLGRGKYQYRLRVEAIPSSDGALASGELLIDAKTFLVDRLVWQLQHLETVMGRAHGTLFLEFDHHGRALVPAISLTEDAPAFPLQPILHTIFGKSLVP